MATKTVKLKGRLGYHKLNPNAPDEFKGQRFWSINFYPDDASFGIWNTLGLHMNKIYEDEDGKWIRLKRPVEKTFKRGNGFETIKFGPVPVVDPSNNVIPDIIGHGSEIDVDLTVYGSAMGSGSRLERITVTKLVPYTPKAKEPSANAEPAPSDLPF